MSAPTDANWLKKAMEDAGIKSVLNPLIRDTMSEREVAEIMLRTPDAIIEREAVALDRQAAWLRGWKTQPRAQDPAKGEA